MVRKFLIVLTNLFFTQYPEFQATIMVLILATALAIQNYVSPYLLPTLNFLEGMTLFSAILVLCGGLMFATTVSRFSESSQTALAVIIIIAVLVCSIGIMFLLVFHIHSAAIFRKLTFLKPTTNEPPLEVKSYFIEFIFYRLRRIIPLTDFHMQLQNRALHELLLPS